MTIRATKDESLISSSQVAKSVTYMQNSEKAARTHETAIFGLPSQMRTFDSRSYFFMTASTFAAVSAASLSVSTTESADSFFSSVSGDDFVDIDLLLFRKSAGDYRRRGWIFIRQHCLTRIMGLSDASRRVPNRRLKLLNSRLPSRLTRVLN